MADEYDQDIAEIQQYSVHYSDRMFAKQETKIIDHFGLWFIFVIVLAILIGGVFEWLRRRG